MDNSHFDEKSGVITASTAWGRWNQTVSEVVIEVDVERGTRGKEVAIEIKPNHISCFVRKQEIFKVIYIFLVTLKNYIASRIFWMIYMVIYILGQTIQHDF